ncbi:GNAT family N-acetyltransferase [Pseudomonas sp. S 311-6]|uniref:GNAT family N-acetyltransferase n=1 Tax=Pseudomonas TaxID=286 RepID=UPI0020982AAC|nr:MULTISPECIES: GNAT family N-acetyltransferase [Pseudomonas]MCO7566125.1 GNAT family N-acetyltransferase [Pseudomonas mosselii]MCO7617129.1 GNAT family N-acetyltransferase [Pseudomonas guariconensis]MCO7637092.1 GNAT family N-acetyltransferase [Pseudomonas sp. S 311-6]
MPAFHCRPLIGPERRLLEHFYRQHGARMRAVADGQQWVAREGGIIAGLNLGAVDGGQWLTGLFVAPQWRGHGVARQLIDTALAETGGPTWLFCHPDLQPFYQRLGFTAAYDLPEALAARLARYQLSKRLVALVRDQSSPPSSPGNSTSV